MSAVFKIIETFSEGKQPPKNEDMFGANETCLVLSDGATDKSGQDFDGKSGGEIAASLVIESCLESDVTGLELVAQATSALHSFYETNNPQALTDSAFRVAATLVVARIVANEIIITQVGDSAFRINGTDVYMNESDLNLITANTRKQYIEATHDIAGSRDFIMPLLKAQHRFQNNPDEPIGFGVIDGTPVPTKFIKTYRFPVEAARTIELVSDGYYGVFPAEVSVAAYEELYKTIQADDPDKYKQYASTKTSDDRTVVIVQISQ